MLIDLLQRSPIPNLQSLLDHWFTHINSIHQQRIELGLDRVGFVANKLSLTTFNCPVITVAGTNGKGSCVKTLETIYVLAGYRVALYTSPHLLEFNERIRIDNSNISDTQLIAAFEIVEAARGNVVLSFFEFTTLAALVLFHQAQCDVIILEVGLGGRLDAVNIVESDVAVLTSVALDHMDYLGADRQSIAYEKASIARKNKPLVCAEEDPPHTIAETVAAKESRLYQVNRDYFYDANTDFICRGEDFYYQLPMPHLKPQNCAAAIMVVELLKKRLPVVINTLREAIVKTVWPGRFEILSTPFSCILDVAHNPHAAAWLAKQVSALSPVAHTVAVVGMLKDKAMCETISELLPFVNEWIVCDLSKTEERGADGSVMMSFLENQGAKCHLAQSVSEAMTQVMQAHCQQQCDRALIFGSFYTISAAKRWISHTE